MGPDNPDQANVALHYLAYACHIEGGTASPMVILQVL